LIGKVVNYRYEVLEKCGDGSFFSVFKARDKVLNRLVAVKVLIPPYSQNPDFADRLINESQAVGDLNHPNITRVFESDSHEGVHFMAVEYVRGINLKDRIRRTGPFSVSYAVDIASAVAQALDFAHRNGVVHGDIRPHNVLTSPEGQVKLTDFGTAKALAAFPAIREATMLRSVHYMAPERYLLTRRDALRDAYRFGPLRRSDIGGNSRKAASGPGAVPAAEKHRHPDTAQRYSRSSYAEGP
jgi:serine/threonine protein kinase